MLREVQKKFLIATLTVMLEYFSDPVRDNDDHKNYKKKWGDIIDKLKWD